MNNGYILLCVLVTASVTYLIRMIPMVFFRKKIENRWVRSFLYYVPYSVLAAMTFPAIFTSTGSLSGGMAGCVVAVVLAYRKRGLLTVAVGAALAAYVVQLLPIL